MTNIEYKDRGNSTVLNKIVQIAIEEALGFSWIKQADERVIRVGVHYPWTEAIGWMKTKFRCSQDSIMKRTPKKVPDIENQRAVQPMERYACHGILKLACNIFSEQCQCLIRIKHHMDNPPRNAYETPHEIIKYIQTFWMPSSHEQWIAINTASKQGYFGATNIDNLTQKVVHYWWSQSMVKKVRQDPDPWVSLEMYLKAQPKVRCNDLDAN